MGLPLADARREAIEVPLAAGFDYHLVKPADMAVLQSILAIRDAQDAHPVRH